MEHGKLTAFDFADDELLVVQVPDGLGTDRLKNLSETLRTLASTLDLEIFIAPMSMDFSKLNDPQKLEVRKALGCTCNSPTP